MSGALLAVAVCGGRPHAEARERFAQILNEGLRGKYVLRDRQAAGSGDRGDLVELKLSRYFVNERRFDWTLFFHIGGGERMLA